MRFIKESKWQVTLMTGAPNVQTITKELTAPSEDIAIRRARTMFPNQQFVQVQATLMDQQTNAPTATPSQQQQTTMDRMRGLTPLRGLAQPGQQQAAESIQYPYSITLPQRFARILRETSPVSVSETNGQHHIVLESEAQMRNFMNRLVQHRDRDGAHAIMIGIRSSIS